MIKYSSPPLSIASDGTKLSFQEKLEAKRTLAKRKMREVAPPPPPPTEGVYDVAVAVQISDCMGRLVGVQITESAEKYARAAVSRDLL